MNIWHRCQKYEGTAGGGVVFKGGTLERLAAARFELRQRVGASASKATVERIAEDVSEFIGDSLIRRDIFFDKACDEVSDVHSILFDGTGREFFCPVTRLTGLALLRTETQSASRRFDCAEIVHWNSTLPAQLDLRAKSASGRRRERLEQYSLLASCGLALFAPESEVSYLSARSAVQRSGPHHGGFYGLILWLYAEVLDARAQTKTADALRSYALTFGLGLSEPLVLTRRLWGFG